MSEPTTYTHGCCPNAVEYLIAHRLGPWPSSASRYSWKVLIRLHDVRRTVRVIYCPWCGVDLEVWRRLQRPALLVVS
jgi:hypothetical protein